MILFGYRQTVKELARLVAQCRLCGMQSWLVVYRVLTWFTLFFVPVLPLWIFRRRLLLASGFLAVGVGAILLGLSSYIPVYAQEALGTGPLVAGLALGALTIGWPISASQAGKVYLRFGFRGCALIGSSLVVGGVALLLLLDQQSSVYEVGAYCLVIGLGMGLTAAPTLIAAQSSVGWAERGVVTANNIFLRSLGSALGVAVFGAMANAVVGSGAVEPARLTDAVHRIFIGMLLVSVVMVVLAGLIPRSADQVTAEPATTAPDTTGPSAPSPARAE